MGTRWLTLVLLVLLQWPATPGRAEEGDALEPINRFAFAINHALVVHLMDPVADAADQILPVTVRRGIGSAFDNLTEISAVAAHLVAGEPVLGAVAAARVAVNTTFGLGGIFDVASFLGLERRDRTFGEALCQWGLLPDPYIVLPLVGPAHVAGAGLVAGAYLLDAGTGWMGAVFGSARMILDLGLAAAALRFAGEMPPPALPDPYAIQRAEFRSMMGRPCGTHRTARPTLAAMPVAPFDRSD